MANVSFSNVTAKYGKNTIFSDFSLEVKSGEIMCLVGPSGCGKTTLVRCLLGLTKPETGRIAIGDRVLFDSEKRINVPVEKRNIGIVFQDYAVWPHMTVLENVSYPLKKRKVNKELIKDRAMKALEQVRMTQYANHLPSQLSGGQQQRVAIARAIVNDPKLLLCDEPTGNLDPEKSMEIMKVLESINKMRGTTIIMATHDKEIVNKMKKQVITLKDGHLVKFKQKGTYAE